MRPIDADVLKQHIDKLPALPDGNFAGNHSALKALINMQPTIEPSTNCSEFPNNSDTVSRQQAIDALQKCRKHCIDPFDSYHIDIQDAENQLSKLPTVQPEPQWIPVSERLPEDYVDVLVWFEYFRYGDYNCLYQTHGIGTYVAEYNSWMINHESGWKDLRVIAWMPLPEPYQKGASPC